MKAFEKWWKEQFKNKPREIDKPIARECKKIAKSAYREALGWVLSEWLWERNPPAQEIKESIEEELAE